MAETLSFFDSSFRGLYDGGAGNCFVSVHSVDIGDQSEFVFKI